jgi:hypothetical protein
VDPAAQPHQARRRRGGCTNDVKVANV